MKSEWKFYSEKLLQFQGNNTKKNMANYERSYWKI